MNTYTNFFGGENIDPSQLSYKGYVISEDLRCQWPFEALDGSNIAAAKIDVAATVGGLSVYLPDARNVSVGKDILFNNTGAHAFTVLDALGNTLINITPGLQWFVYLIDNSTEAGGWRVVQFSAATSSANASSLAGAGLRANVSLLDQNLIISSLNAGYTFSTADRAGVFRNNTGAVTYDFDGAASLENGWFVYVINGGTGVVTLDPTAAETIDGQSTKAINPDESCIVFSDGSNLWTLGYGRAITSTVTGAAINIAGSGTYTLSSSEATAQVQDFSGALTGARTIEYGTGVGYWFVQNLTSGAYDTTFKVNAIDTGVVIPQGSFSILRSNGTTMSVAFTATVGTVTQVNTVSGETTGGPITTTGSIGLANTAVTPGSYGGAGLLSNFQVDQKGRLLTASTTQMNIKDSAACTSAQLAAVISDETGTGAAVFGTGPTISNANLTGSPVAPTPAPGDNDTSVSTTAFVTAAIAAAIAAIPALAGFTTGDIKWSLSATEESGYIWLNGRTLGSAGSAATLKGTTYQPLYEFFWNNYSDTLCPVSTGRGASAAADFAANKTITSLDSRGTGLAAAENMGGSNRGNLGSNPSTGGFSSTASLGTQAGEKSHVQTTAELATHAHGIQVYNIGLGGSGGGAVIWAGDAGFTTYNQGSSTAFNVTQPTLVCNVLVKL